MKKLALDNQITSQDLNTKKNYLDGTVPPTINDECKSYNGIIDIEDHPEPREIPICSEAGLYLRPIGTCDGVRFARLFAEAWDSIPKIYKKSIVRHWQNNKYLNNTPYNPYIEVFSQTVNINGIKKWDCMATTCRNGHQLTFEAALVDHIPDSVLKTIIVYQLASAQAIIFHPMRGSDSSPYKLRSRDVEVLMSLWGHKPDEIRFWFTDNKCNIDDWLKENSL